MKSLRSQRPLLVMAAQICAKSAVQWFAFQRQTGITDRHVTRKVSARESVLRLASTAAAGRAVRNLLFSFRARRILLVDLLGPTRATHHRRHVA